jgi:hypothetical protein
MWLFSPEVLLNRMASPKTPRAAHKNVIDTAYVLSSTNYICCIAYHYCSVVNYLLNSTKILKARRGEKKGSDVRE